MSSDLFPSPSGARERICELRVRAMPSVSATLQTPGREVNLQLQVRDEGSSKPAASDLLPSFNTRIPDSNSAPAPDWDLAYRHTTSTP
jgi:hypothetical protein